MKITTVTPLALLCLVLGACATPAREAEMTIADVVSTQNYDASLSIAVYGDVGGFASMYFDLPREDVEDALFRTLENSGIFRSVAVGGEADYKLSVGLMHLVQPQWSGTVTLETTWALTSTSAGRELNRETIRSTAPASFTEKREATEEATIRNFQQGINWMLSVIDQESVTE